LFLQEVENLRKIPKLHGKCWMAYDVNNQTTMLSRKPRKAREIASLTKIMTCYLVLKLVKKFNVDPEARSVKVSKTACMQGGTTAKLIRGDKLTVKELLFGLMLPSGNDAAFALAEYFGCLLYFNFMEERRKRGEADANLETEAGTIREVNILNIYQ
jgi:D-alanyl-D-alanine carboxypeptidase